ncbi:MAG: Ig-like domain-containing protein, partial [Candidatus Binatia bacterium]
MIRLLSNFVYLGILIFLLFNEGVSSSNASAAQLTLTWTDTSNNEDGFKIERKAGITGAFAQLATVGANATSYADGSVINGTTYCYRVRAHNTAGDSGYTNEACSTASADTQTPTVSLTAPSNGATVSGSSVTTSANASDNVGVIGVQFLLDGANLGTEDTTAPYAVTWNTTTVTNGPHTLTARARDAVGNQTTSTAVTVTVSNTAPPPPDPSGLVAAYSFDEG